MKDSKSKKDFLKKVVKRNQVIIAALAVMIIIAGYLNVTGQSNRQNTQNNNPQNENSGNVANGENGETGTNGDNSENDGSVSSGGNILDISNEDIVPPGDSDSQDVEASNSDIKDTPTSSGEDGSNVGNAVLASTTLGSNYFGNAKLGREQIRSANKETLEGVVNDASISDEAKAEAIATLVAMTTAAALEDEIETLLEAKGYETVCYIDSNEIDVIVNALEITDQDVAKIEDVVMRNTEIDATGIVITNVVTEE